MPRDTLIAVRAHDRADRTHAAFADSGFRLHVEEVLSYRPLLSVFPESDADAVIATSARAFEFLPQGQAAFFQKPVFVAGDFTAQAARVAGFVNVTVAGDTAEDLIAFLRAEPPQRLLYLRGDRVAVDCAAALAPLGFTVDLAVVYETREVQTLSPLCLDLLNDNRVAGVLFFSRETAAHFCALAENESIIENIKTIQAFCFSEAVVKSLHHLPWSSLSVAARPTLAAFAALVRQVRKDV